MLLFLVVCGLYHGTSHLHPPTDPNSLYQLFKTPQEATLSGTLLKAPKLSTEKSKLLIEADAFYTVDASVAGNHAVLPSPRSFMPAQGKIELSLRGLPPNDLSAGDKLLVRAFVSHPKGFNTPGTFNYQKFLSHKSIWATGWVRSPTHILAVPVAEKSFFQKARFLPEQLRQRINHFLTSHLAPQHSSLYKALLTGDRSTLSPETLENFKGSGTFHLLAISGLHMGLIAFVVGASINWLLKRSPWILLHTPSWKIAALLTLPLLLAYSLLAGFQTPVARSLIMTAVFLFAVLFDLADPSRELGRRFLGKGVPELGCLDDYLSSGEWVTATTFRLRSSNYQRQVWQTDFTDLLTTARSK